MLSLIVTLCVVGVLLWLVNTYVPMQAGIKRVLNIAVLCIVVLWLLQVFGVLHSIDTISVPHLR